MSSDLAVHEDEMVDIEKVVFVLADGGSFEIPIGIKVEKAFMESVIKDIVSMWLENQPEATIVKK
jgi:hypothetical protein